MESHEYLRAAETARTEFSGIIARGGSEEELYLWRQSVKERFPGFYKELLITVRDSLSGKAKAAS